MAFFSIIVPVYNTENYLSQCLESLKNQTLRDFEVLVINDGSPNKTNFPKSAKQIFDEINDYRFEYFEQKNSGVSAARNLGLEKSSGKWLIFVDSDDFVESDFLLKTLAIINQGQNPYNNLVTFEGDKFTPWAKFSKFVPLVNNLSNSLVFSNHINMGSTVFCKKYINFKFHLVHGGEDAMFGWRYMLNLPDQNIKFVNSGATYYYRQHPNQHTKSENAEVIQFAQLNEYLEINKFRIKDWKNKLLANIFILRFDLYSQKMHTDSKIKKLFLSISAKLLTIFSIVLAGTRKA